MTSRPDSRDPNRTVETALHRLELTLDTPAENLALDEALLDEAEALADGTGNAPVPASMDTSGEVLRLWEPSMPFVVLGRASHAEREVDLGACRRLGIPVLRRASGGAAVVVGPGCLLYAVVLSYDRRPELRPLDAAHRFVLSRIAEAVSANVLPVAQAGTSDLVLQDPVQRRKCSGNSLRCKRTHFLYHGTLMYDFDIDLIEACLRLPPRQPEYRQRRRHAEFLVNLPVAAADIRSSLTRVWGADVPLSAWPRGRTACLVENRYTCDSWTWSR